MRTITPGDGWALRERAAGVDLAAQSAEDGVWFADNALDLFPDDPQRIAARGPGEGEIVVR